MTLPPRSIEGRNTRFTIARSRPPWPPRIACAAALGAWLLGSAPARAQSEADVATARTLFIEGSKLADEGRWADARDRYERSLALKRAALTLYSLAVAQKNTGSLVESLENFRAFLAEPFTPTTRPYEQPARDAVAELERRIARIDLWIEPPGARAGSVRIDGLQVPAQAYGQPRAVNPGTRAVAVKADGFRDVRVSVKLAEGARETVRLVLEPASTMETVSSSLSGRGLPFALLGTGTAILGAGVSLGVAGMVEASDAGQDAGKASNARALGVAGDVLIGLGIGTAAAGGIVLWARSSHDPTTAQVTLQPWVGPTSAGVRGTF